MNDNAEVNAATYVPIEDLATHLTLTVSTIRSWVRKGYIPKSTYLKVGSTYRFKIDDVVDSLKQGKPPAAATWQEEIVDDTPAKLELDL